MNRNSILGVIIIILLVALGVYGYSTYKPDTSSVSSDVNDSAIRATVEQFGSVLKNVSLLAPDASAQIQTHYAPYVAPQLLAQWAADPQNAPGRSTSSPWPDHMNVVSVTPRASGNAFESYQVEGNVVEVVSASGGGTAPAAVYPVSMTVEKQNGIWMITALSKGSYSVLPQQMTITGVWECLPHKNKTGPQTDECAFGIAKDQSDGHYAIDTSLMSQYPVDFATGTHVQVIGIVTPADQLNSVQIYDIDGMIQATSITKL
ncbi:MAG TPA: hypothetical protein VG984_02580 [Candidatus Paceibacterota bacterium]|nr:hypothetical protein [Candidatus Paceibacterota bacterium]